MYRILLAASALSLASCATPGTTSSGPLPAAGQPASASAESELVAQQAVEPGSAAPEGEEIEVVAVPGVAPAPAAAAQVASGAGSEVVCRREIPTGSRLPVRVCRSRAEIEARKERDQAWLDEKQQDGLAGMGGSNF